MKVTLPYKVVLIKRGEGSKTPVIVLPHEIDILRAQFGDNSIEITNAVPPIKDVEIETEDEFERLQDYYRGSNESPNPTRDVFRNLEDFEMAFKKK